MISSLTPRLIHTFRPPTMRTSIALLFCSLLLASPICAAPQAYLDKQSAAPGETVSLHASISSPTYTVKVLRSLGFGNSVEMLNSGPLAGATQPTSRGSYAWTPSTPQLEIRGGLSLEAWIYPTYRSGTEAYGILSKYGVPNDTAYMLYLLPNGRVCFYLSGTGQFNAASRLISTNPGFHATFMWLPAHRTARTPRTAPGWCASDRIDGAEDPGDAIGGVLDADVQVPAADAVPRIPHRRVCCCLHRGVDRRLNRVLITVSISKSD